MNTPKALTLAAALFLGACASQSTIQPVGVTRVTDKVVLAGGPGCSKNEFPQAVDAGETHRCFFPTSGEAAAAYATPAQRVAHGRQFAGQQCRVFEAMSERTIQSASTPSEPILRVGFACRQ